MEKSWDENDTVANSKFYISNINNNTPAFEDEKDALNKAIQHYNTPQESILNNLGQRFLFIEKNLNGKQLVTCYELDIEGNELSITDPRQYKLNEARLGQDKVKNFVHSFDMTGTQLSVDSVDAGLRLTLNNALEQPIHTWDSRGFHVKTTYDELQRPFEIHVDGNGLNQIVEKMEYGENKADDKKKNLRGELIKHYDQAGVEYFDLYGIKGELRISRRKIRKEYKGEVNWNNLMAVDLENEIFVTETIYDALGRIASQKNPDESIYKPEYHPSGLLKKLEVAFKNEANPTNYVENITYNAKGQREKIIYGNGVTTEYVYERETLRLIHLKTFRSRDSKLLQDIFYTYDPAGNITRIVDHSHKKVLHDQTDVESLCDYTYDALYQLTRAIGREHPALSKDNYKKGGFKHSQFLPLHQQVHLNDVKKLQRYTQNYAYDDSGNLTQMSHTAFQSPRSWTRNFYPSQTSNRTVPLEMLKSNKPDDFFDENGNLIELEHLRNIQWNYRDNIASVDLIQRENGPSDSEYYVYDSEGNRVRKVFERYTNGGTVIEIEEKLYLGNCEIKCIRKKTDNAVNTIFKRKTLHVMDDKQRITLVHHWEKDDLSRETDMVGQRKIHYHLSNHLGSCYLELSQNAEIISYEEYFPYGGTSLIAGKNKKEVKIKEYRYSGKERDDSTGLYYFGARYYAPWIGRWVNCDPVGEDGGINLYEFVTSNPIRMGDEEGRQPTNLVDVFRATTNIPPTDFIKKDIPRLRKQFGIPPPPHNRRYGGWLVNDKEGRRRIDFYVFGKKEFKRGTEKPKVWRMLRKLKSHAASVARQLRGLRKTKWGVDEALTLVTTWREAGHKGFGSKKSVPRVESFWHGGLDKIGKDQTILRSRGYFPPGFPQQLQTFQFPNPFYPDKTVYSAFIPKTHMIEAYGAILNWAKTQFLTEAKNRGFDVTNLTKDALRAWTVTWMAGPGNAKKILNLFRSEGTYGIDPDLNDLVNPQRNKPFIRYHAVKTALVRAAEAKLLESKINLSAR
jgi:RHS repeat-associated protein